MPTNEEEGLCPESSNIFKLHVLTKDLCPACPPLPAGANHGQDRPLIICLWALNICKNHDLRAHVQVVWSAPGMLTPRSWGACPGIQAHNSLSKAIINIIEA
ncbi:hypothetical protein CEXT_735991 [Caerostris extrusa]|uniref:Uncharacterized protein n=1 Tax=Caerostris extrusa TaxID=172846 RepID=A0AAV4V101_CAEEX|nr:hypothetical protein CEXT_735991 [Caerostris extrusa]